MEGVKEAATHFTHYLVASQVITDKKPSVGREQLKSVFSEMYQPQYSVRCLEPQNLVSALAKTGVLEKPSSEGNADVKFKWSRIQDQGFQIGQFPNKLPAHLTKPKQRVIVNPRYSQERVNLQRPDAVSNEKCDICNVHLTPDTVEEHRSSELHILRVTYRQNRKEFDAVKHLMDVRIVGQDQQHGARTLEVSCRVGVKYEVGIEFVNRLDEKELSLEQVIELIPHKDVELEHMDPLVITAGEIKILTVKAKFSARGAVLYPLIFKIMPSGANKAEYFLKDITFRTQSEFMDELAPSQPYRAPLGPLLKLRNAPKLSGKPLERQGPVLTHALLKMQFEIPPILLRFLNHGFKPHENMSEKEKKALHGVLSLTRDSLTKENYAQLFELLLFIEEHQMTQDIHHYDMHDAILQQDGDGFWLRVPGLVDKRPSLLINDTVIVNFVNDRSLSYEGFVHRIVNGRVLLNFHNNFTRKYKGQKLEVEFTISRGALKSMYRALYIASLHQAPPLLFPETESRPQHQPPLKPWFNKAIEKNPQQQSAIRNIVYNSSQNSPYLVFGPPGTGKTVTLVETIMQLWDPKGKSTRILVCTPSNAAADEITVRLLRMAPMASVKSSDVGNHILRMCAMSRQFEQMPEVIQDSKITNHDPRDGLPYYPAKHKFMSYDIVICTFSTSARLLLADVPSGHFTHIFMDEVGQALEPEALIPIAGLATNPAYPGQFQNQVIMAGDPKQLGPILQSPIAAKFGLDKSMLERLMSMPLYSKRFDTNKYDPNVLTKLVLNYRSHPSLLKVSNDLFYDGELKAIGDPNVINAACNWRMLKKNNFPLIFHGVEGIDEREGNSPSFFNRQEIEIVTDYIKKIQADRVAVGKEIGVVTPYNMQVKKIKKACELLKLSDIDVGSVEQFQGQERKVIIISTVRSQFRFVSFDYMFQLGFLKNPKRFNVAVTRARSLLIVVGNPKVLQHDKCWRTLLEHCVQNDSYAGVPFDFETMDSNKEASLNLNGNVA